MTYMDLRRPAKDETPLSREEVRIGLREGTIPYGPWSVRMAHPTMLETRPLVLNPSLEQAWRSL